jgi:hypothetical protein
MAERILHVFHQGQEVYTQHINEGEPINVDGDTISIGVEVAAAAPVEDLASADSNVRAAAEEVHVPAEGEAVSEPEPEPEPEPVEDYVEFSKSQLVDEALHRNLPHSGNKAAIIERLQADDNEEYEEA